MAENAIEKVLGQVDDLVIATMNEHALAGLAVGVVHRGELVYASPRAASKVRDAV